MRNVTAILGLFGVLFLTVGSSAQDQEKNGKRAFCCPRTWYTSEDCTCKPNPKCSECPCGNCSGGGKCVCIEDLRKGNGTLVGTVTHKSVAKFPTVVYVDAIPERTFVPPAWSLHIDQKNKEFMPKVLPMIVGSTVEFLNSDAFEHNINSPDSEKFDLGNWGLNEKRSYTFKHPGVYTLLCKLHPEMVGYAVVVKTPYFAVANEKGEFRIPNVPAGKWKVKVWNERMKPKQTDATFEIVVEEGKDAKVEIKP